MFKLKLKVCHTIKHVDQLLKIKIKPSFVHFKFKHLNKKYYYNLNNLLGI